MTWPLLLTIFLGSSAVLLLVLGRKNAPVSKDEWDALLDEESKRIMAGLELQVLADKAMASDALQKALDARNTMAFAKAIRLVDMAASVLQDASNDRLARLKGMALAVRMASAILPIKAVPVGCCSLREVRTLFALGAVLHHMLVSATERMLLRVWLLRFAYGLALRAMVKGTTRLHADPALDAAWAQCSAAVKDFTVTLDPAHVEAYRVLLDAARHRRAA